MSAHRAPSQKALPVQMVPGRLDWGLYLVFDGEWPVFPWWSARAPLLRWQSWDDSRHLIGIELRVLCIRFRWIQPYEQRKKVT